MEALSRREQLGLNEKTLELRQMQRARDWLEGKVPGSRAMCDGDAQTEQRIFTADEVKERVVNVSKAAVERALEEERRKHAVVLEAAVLKERKMGADDAWRAQKTAVERAVDEERKKAAESLKEAVAEERRKGAERTREAVQAAAKLAKSFKASKVRFSRLFRSFPHSDLVHEKTVAQASESLAPIPASRQLASAPPPLAAAAPPASHVPSPLPPRPAPSVPQPIPTLSDIAQPKSKPQEMDSPPGPTFSFVVPPNPQRIPSELVDVLHITACANLDPRVTPALFLHFLLRAGKKQYPRPLGLHKLNDKNILVAFRSAGDARHAFQQLNNEMMPLAKTKISANIMPSSIASVFYWHEMSEQLQRTWEKERALPSGLWCSKAPGPKKGISVSQDYHDEWRRILAGAATGAVAEESPGMELPMGPPTSAHTFAAYDDDQKYYDPEGYYEPFADFRTTLPPSTNPRTLPRLP